MTEGLKDELIQTICGRLLGSLTPEQLSEVRTACIMSLHGYTITKEETALSTEFAVSNSEYLKRFIVIKTIKGLSKRSIEFYAGEMRRLFTALEDKPVPEITSDDIRYVLAVRKSRGDVRNVSLDNSLRTYRSFFGTMLNEGLIQKDPTKRIDSIKWDSIPREPFTDIEVEKLREACDADPSPVMRARSHALVETLISTGCRASEVCGMNRSACKGGSIEVCGKGSKYRTVYFNARAELAVAKYLELRTDSNDALFVRLRAPYDRLTVSGLESCIHALGEAAGVDSCFPHRFRHTVATTALRRGMPLDQVSALLGHEDIKTTQIYAKTDKSQVEESHRKYLY